MSVHNQITVQQNTYNSITIYEVWDQKKLKIFKTAFLLNFNKFLTHVKSRKATIQRCPECYEMLKNI